MRRRRHAAGHVAPRQGCRDAVRAPMGGADMDLYYLVCAFTRGHVPPAVCPWIVGARLVALHKGDQPPPPPPRRTGSHDGVQGGSPADGRPMQLSHPSGVPRHLAPKFVRETGLVEDGAGAPVQLGVSVPGGSGHFGALKKWCPLRLEQGKTHTMRRAETRV